MNNNTQHATITLHNIIEATLQSRPNRFTGIIQLNNNTTTAAYIPNPGRMKELMNKGQRALLKKTENTKTKRKTKCDLIAVEYNDQIISIDSRLPNKIIHKALLNNTLAEFKNFTTITPEYTYANSRLDFYLEKPGSKHLIEVKSCTLVEEGIAKFPDAPTTRGQRHLQELTGAAQQGYHAHILFIIQRSDASTFKPHKTIDPEFARLLSIAAKKGVNIHAHTCNITENKNTSSLTISLNKTIPVSLH